MIVAFCVCLLQAATSPVVRVDVITAATEVIVTGRAGVPGVSVSESRSIPAPALETVRGIVTVRDADESTSILRGRYVIEVPASAAVTVRVRCRLQPDSPCPNAKVRISRVATVNYESADGEALIEHVTGSVTATTLTGKLDIRNVGGSVEGSSQTNAVSVSDVVGNAVVRSTTGIIAVASVRGNVAATNTTGEIRLTGPLVAGSRYDLSTDIGHIRVRIDASANARVDVNAPAEALRVHVAAARTTVGDERRRTVVIGSGAARVSARTLRGGVDIGRRR